MARDTVPARWGDHRKARIGELFDVLAADPNGLTIDQIAEGLGVPVAIARNTVHDLRIQFGEDDTINLAANSQGRRQPWIYKLVGDYDSARPWLANRLGDLETRLDTIDGMAASIARGAKKGTREQWKADKIHRTLSYLKQELDAMEKEVELRGDAAITE